MVSSQEEEVFRIEDFVNKQQGQGFQRLLSSVDVVPEEELVGLGGKLPEVEKTEQVVVLPVNVAQNFDRRSELQEHRLTLNDFEGVLDEEIVVTFRELDFLSGFFPFRREKFFKNGVVFLVARRHKV